MCEPCENKDLVPSDTCKQTVIITFRCKQMDCVGIYKSDKKYTDCVYINMILYLILAVFKQ